VFSQITYFSITLRVLVVVIIIPQQVKPTRVGSGGGSTQSINDRLQIIALGVGTIVALTLFGGHNHRTFLELAMEAIRTGRVSNMPL